MQGQACGICKVKEDTRTHKRYLTSVMIYPMTLIISTAFSIRSGYRIWSTPCTEFIQRCPHKSKIALLRSDIQKAATNTIFYYGNSDKETEVPQYQQNEVRRCLCKT